MPRGKSKLAQIVDRLRAHYGPQSPPPARSAFELILWEKVAYLADDEKRAAAFQALRKRIGLTPKAILAADPVQLREIAALGGAVAPADRAEHMRAAAELVLGEFD